ncbi:MAG: 4-(cytidine 5'-diphospho)-2-C-methyl-D-erythritol kinase [Bacteroidetes bacterium]|nr:4-(cytidine 5'-diphospho)-2-C-methyl-D-erythritol kinase [Bacteroidota bacterium]
MILFPPAKINLGLRILRKRTDGYHDLDTVFYPIGLTDLLEISPLLASPRGRRDERVQLKVTGLELPGNSEDNLCLKAWHLLKADFPDLPTVQMHLHKIIPIGAGLGGGSADGAYALRGLNEKFKLGLTADQLVEYAAKLGSDCPFFIYDEPCLGAGRGEILEPISVSLRGYWIALINPGIHVSTKEAFAGVSPHEHHKPIRQIIAQPIETWQTELINDFESSIFPHYPKIKEVKEKLIASGALYASMSGSGSTVYGIFTDDPGQLKFESCMMFRV